MGTNGGALSGDRRTENREHQHRVTTLTRTNPQTSKNHTYATDTIYADESIYVCIYVCIGVHMWVFICVLFLFSAPIATRVVIEKQCTTRTFVRTRSNDEWCYVADQPPCSYVHPRPSAWQAGASSIARFVEGLRLLLKQKPGTIC